MAKKKNKNDAEEQRRLDALERHKKQTKMRREKAEVEAPDVDTTEAPTSQHGDQS